MGSMGGGGGGTAQSQNCIFDKPPIDNPHFPFASDMQHWHVRFNMKIVRMFFLGYFSSHQRTFPILVSKQSLSPRNIIHRPLIKPEASVVIGIVGGRDFTDVGVTTPTGYVRQFTASLSSQIQNEAVLSASSLVVRLAVPPLASGQLDECPAVIPEPRLVPVYGDGPCVVGPALCGENIEIFILN